MEFAFRGGMHQRVDAGRAPGIDPEVDLAAPAIILAAYTSVWLNREPIWICAGTPGDLCPQALAGHVAAMSACAGVIRPGGEPLVVKIDTAQPRRRAGSPDDYHPAWRRVREVRHMRSVGVHRHLGSDCWFSAAYLASDRSQRSTSALKGGLGDRMTGCAEVRSGDARLVLGPRHTCH